MQLNYVIVLNAKTKPSGCNSTWIAENEISLFSGVCLLLICFKCSLMYDRPATSN